MARLLNLLYASLFAASLCLAQPESLLIGPGDLIHVQVFDTPEMDQHLRVLDNGSINLMFVGQLQIDGLTPVAAAHAIEGSLVARQYMKHPQVTVTVEQYATQSVSVLGQVQNPGLFSIDTPQPMLKVLTLAGGLTDMADRHITIERHGPKHATVSYFLSNRSEEAIANDVLVYPGDSVLVPKAGIVYVLGDVGHPGGFPMTTNTSQITVLQALALAGSTGKTALANRSRLIRRTAAGAQEIPLSLASMQSGGKPDMLLQPDDIIYVPFSFLKNMALSGANIAAQAGSAAIYLAK